MSWNSTSDKFDVSLPASYGDSYVLDVLSNYQTLFVLIPEITQVVVY